MRSIGSNYRSKPSKDSHIDAIYDLDDPHFFEKLVFRPHRAAPGLVEKCKHIPRFHGFKTLTESELKERKRKPVPQWEFQGPMSMSPEVLESEIPIYKGSILEKRQQPLTGKDTFDGMYC